jgi:glycosyltransferase involved in cell wall biosynthesis
MKIAHVIHGFPPHSNAGAEIYHYRLAREQARTEDVSVFHRIGDTELDEYAVKRENREGLDIWRVNNTLRECDSFEKIYKNPGMAAVFREFLDTVKPDVVHIGHLTMLSTLIVKELAGRNIPRVMTLHDFWLVCLRGQLLDMDLKICSDPESAPCEECHPEQTAIAESSKAVKIFRKITAGLRLKAGLKRALFRRLNVYLSKRRGKEGEDVDFAAQIERRRGHMRSIFENVDLFIAPSDFLREQFIKFGVAPDRIIQSDYGQDAAPFKNFRRKPSDKIRFGFAAAIIPSKGLHVLLEAFRGIDTDRAELNIHGGFVEYHESEDYPSRIESLAKIAGVKMHGPYQPREAAEVFSDIDVLVVPSLWYENQPLVIEEAFMASAPVIASNAGGMAELVKPEENGLLFELGNPKSLKEAMQRFTEDNSLLDRLRRGIPRVKTIEENAAETIGIYRGLLEK